MNTKTFNLKYDSGEGDLYLGGVCNWGTMVFCNSIFRMLNIPEGEQYKYKLKISHRKFIDSIEFEVSAKGGTPHFICRKLDYDSALADGADNLIYKLLPEDCKGQGLCYGYLMYFRLTAEEKY